MLPIVLAAFAADPEAGSDEPVSALEPDPPDETAPGDPADPEASAPVDAEPSAAELLRDPGLSDRLLELGTRLLDERVSTASRCEAAEQLGATGDARALGLLRAGARDPDRAVQSAAVRAALGYRGAEAVAVAVPLLRGSTGWSEKLDAVARLGGHGSPEAAALLWEVSGDRAVAARVRAVAMQTLRDRYPDAWTELGARRGVADPIGGLVAVGATAMTGGVMLSSVGTWGQFDGGTAIGAVGGSAIGLGSGVLFATRRQLTAGQGLAYASGASWGLTYGVWATHAIHGRRKFMDGYFDQDLVAQQRDLGAAYRAVGAGLGAGLGAWAATKEPLGWDVLEVDLAGYLGSAVVLAGTGLATYRPPQVLRDGSNWEARRRYQLSASRRLGASSMVGGALGLGAGVLLSDRWDLDWNDGVFAFTLGAEGAWIGAFTPMALRIDDTDLKGSIRLPWHLAAIGGLVVSEIEPMSLARSGSGAVGMVGGNALGAGIGMLARGDDATVAQIMLPVGIATTTGAILAAPKLDPKHGDWAMLGIGVPIAVGQAAMIAGAADYEGALRGDQNGGLSLAVGGATALGLLALSPAVDPAPDTMVALGSGAVWGAYYGLLTPYALRLDPNTSGTLLSGAATSQALLATTGVLLLPSVGVRPADLVIPELSGLTGATVGALVAALASGDGEDVALGSVAGSVVGFGVGGVARATVARSTDFAVRPLRGLPGHWQPHFGQHLGPDGEPVMMYGISARGW